MFFHKVLWRGPSSLNGLLLIPCRKKLMFEFSIEKVCAKLTARFAHTSSLFFFSPSPTFSPLFSNFSGIFLNPNYSFFSNLNTIFVFNLMHPDKPNWVFKQFYRRLLESHFSLLRTFGFSVISTYNS